MTKCLRSIAVPSSAPRNPATTLTTSIPTIDGIVTTSASEATYSGLRAPWPYGRALGNIAAVFILFLGVTAALNQIDVATTVTTPILIAVLAIIAGVIIVGAGGGLIKPMQQRWEALLSKAEEEAPKIQQEARNAPSVTEQAKQAGQQLRKGAQDRPAPAATPAHPAPPPLN